MNNTDTIAKLKELLKKRGEHLRQHSPTTKWMNGLDRIDEAILTNLPAILEELRAAQADRNLHLEYHGKLQSLIIAAHVKALPNNWEYCDPRTTIDLLVAECRTAQAACDSLKQHLSEARVTNKRLERETMTTKRWYHCWLKHSWSNWQPTQFYPIQHRQCKMCGKIQWNRKSV